MKKLLHRIKTGTAAHVVAHAQYKASRGKRPSLSFLNEKNPRKALALAQDVLRISPGSSDELRKKLIMTGVRRAQERARREGMDIGTSVAHTSDPFIYSLESKDGNVATCIRSDDSGVRKDFPLDELFSIAVAKSEAQSAHDDMQVKAILKVTGKLGVIMVSSVGDVEIV